MASLHREPIPGTTWKILIEQDEFLSEFVDMMRKRFELDKEYTENLRRLRASANPIWAESAAKSITSPFIDLLDKEIELRENTTNSLFTTLDKAPPSRSPDQPDEEGNTPTTKYKELQTAYEEYLLRFREVNTPECITSLQAWYQRPRIVNKIQDMTVNEIEEYVFPAVDRGYRECVINQHRASQKVLQWHKDYLPRCLDTHQQRVEDIKSILDSVAFEYSRLASQLVQVFAAMTGAISSISSSRYISPLHVSQEREMGHSLTQPVVYRNFYTDGQEAYPVFGLPLPQKYIEALSGQYGPFYRSWTPVSIETVFKLEKRVTEVGHMHDLLNREGKVQLPPGHKINITAFFFSIPPFIHIPTGLLTRNPGKWKRNRLAEQMKTISNQAKRHSAQTVSRSPYFIIGKTAAALWCHNPEAVNFLKAIFRKWDFENDCPFPDGVIRFQVSENVSKTVWKNTGDHYSPQGATLNLLKSVM